MNLDVIGYSFERALNAFYFECDVISGNRRVGNGRRRNVEALSRHFEARGDGVIQQVPVLEDCDPDIIYRDYVQKRRPVVLKGAAANWRATQNWSFDAFKALYGEEMLYIAKETFERHTSGLGYQIDFEPHTVADFVDRVNAGEAIYLKFLPILKEHPELLDDLDLDACSLWSDHSRDRFDLDNEFYMGGAGTVTHLHNERSDIFHACIEGRKRWLLFSPENSIFLYPIPTRTLFVGSEVDFTAPNFETHPWFRYASGYETVLEKGDVLYFPTFYWHAVENLEPVISANYLWHDPWRALWAWPIAWLNGALLRKRGKGTLEHFVDVFGDRTLPNIHHCA